MLFTISCEKPSGVESTESIPDQGAHPLPALSETEYRNSINDLQGKQKYDNSSESINWLLFEPLLQQARHEAGTELVALFGVMNYEQEYYNYYIQPLGFSEKAMAEAEGKLRPSFYEISTEETGTARISVAWIPDSDRAEFEFLRWIRPRVITTQSTLNKAKSTETQCPSEAYFEQSELVSEDANCELDEIVVTAEPYNPGGGDEPEPDWTWPSDPFDPSGGGGGGPNNDNPECNPPDYCEEPEDDFCELNPTADVCTEPCETNDEVLDDEIVQQKMEELWEASNADAPEFQRKEQGGWIIKDPVTNEISFEEFPPSWARKPCGIDLPANITVPPNTIGMLHTHPFTIGEKMYSCLKAPVAVIQQFQGQFDQVVKKYNNQPSPGDIELMNTFAQAGFDLDGYIIDEQGIVKYDENTVENNSSTMTTHSRCAY